MPSKEIKKEAIHSILEQSPLDARHYPGQGILQWWAHQDLNLGPSDYESPALTTELWALDKENKTLKMPAWQGADRNCGGMEVYVSSRL